MAHYELFTDGACSGNPGPGGWGFILRGGTLPEELVQSGGEFGTTNNRMELLAVIRGLDCLADSAKVVVLTDSQYCVNGLTTWIDGWKKRGWRKADRSPVLNQDLWLQLDTHRLRLAIDPRWIRGHNEHPENERCDRLAVAAIDNLRRAGIRSSSHGG